MNVLARAAGAGRELFDRTGLLLAWLATEAVPRSAEAAVVGAAWGGGRYERFLNAEGNVIAEALRKPAAELTRADARSYACTLSMRVLVEARGGTALHKAAGFASTMGHFGLVSPQL